MFEFFALAVAVVALIVARKAFNQAAVLRARLDAIEAAGLQARPACHRSAAHDERDEALPASSPGIAAEQPATPAAEIEAGSHRTGRAEPVEPNDAIGVTTRNAATASRRPRPASRNALVPAGWSGWAA